MLAAQKQNIDLASIVVDAGVELKQRGARHVGLCPFHNEKTPSFYVFSDQHFKCFGCGEHGDCIDFIQKLHGLSFKDALKHLGIERGGITPEVKNVINKRKVEKKREKEAKQFEADLTYTLSLLINATHKATRAIKTIADLEEYGDILQPLSWWEYNLELLYFGDRRDRQKVCQEFQGMEVIPVKRLFKPEFNYLGWLQGFNKNGEPENVECQRIEISFG